MFKRMWQLKEAFPEAFFNHCFAIKANPIRGVLKTVLDTGFMGAECASIAEVIHAHECGFLPEKIVYDSPVKSKVVLEYFAFTFDHSTHPQMQCYN